MAPTRETPAPAAPAPGSKEDLERQLAAAQEDLERTRGQLAEARAATAAPVGAASPAQQTFVVGRPEFRGGTKLSEGERQALEISGVVADPHGGGQLLASDYDIEVKTEDGRRALAAAEHDRAALGDAEKAHRQGVRGVDFVYPSVAPGVLAPDAAVRGAQPETARAATTDTK